MANHSDVQARNLMSNSSFLSTFQVQLTNILYFIPKTSLKFTHLFLPPFLPSYGKVPSLSSIFISKQVVATQYKSETRHGSAGL
jgi:hypothetical protein